MTVTGKVAWFDLKKQFGFVALSDGDAFLHMLVLKEAGYVWLHLAVSREPYGRVTMDFEAPAQLIFLA